jgi:hypothetical protein
MPGGLFNDHCSDLFALSEPQAGVGPILLQASQGEQQPVGLAAGGLRTFPYADLIREHLAQGRILAAHRLFDFAKDLISDAKLVKVLSPPKIKKNNKLDVDRSPEFLWLRENSLKFQGQWVALVGNGLVASAATLAELLAQLKSTPPMSKPLIHHLD